MRYLKQNTATRVTVGPALDVSDGVTPELSLTVTDCLVTFIVDNAGVPTLVIDAAPTASGGDNDMVHITSDSAGYYDYELTAAQTNYVGRAILNIIDTDVHLPIFHEFTILPANVYDSMMGTDILDVSVTQIGGVAQSLADLKDFADTGYDPSTHLAQADVARLGGVAQSATDLKDFADTGYDPSTHKVQGVVLTDTCTTNTDMRGTNSAALASVCTETRLAELDAANLPKTTDDTATDVAAVHVHVGTIDGHVTADYGATEKSAIDLIDDASGGLADIHTDLITASAYIDTEVAAILADTDEIQAELANGGRTDLLIDSIVTATGAVEGTITLRQALSAILAACAGKSNGGGTTTIHFRNQADDKNRITATVDGDGNRTAITLDVT
jgi:hypothetical protein